MGNHIEHTTPNYNQITKNIWIGNNMCCTIHGAELFKLGFDADLDLEENRAEEPPHTKIYLWLPTKDHAPPTIAQLHLGVVSLSECVRRNLKVYVHCKNGHGRAPTLVATYLISTGKTPKKALKFIKSKRPGIHLQDSQIAALQEFKKLFIKERSKYA